MNVADWVGALSGVVVIVGGVWALGRKTLRRLREFLDDWNGEPARPGVPERKGVMVRLGDMETRIFKIEHEVKPDHGRSMHDKVDRIEQAITGEKE